MKALKNESGEKLRCHASFILGLDYIWASSITLEIASSDI